MTIPPRIYLLASSSSHRKNQTVEEARIGAGVYESTAHQNDQQCGHRLDAAAPDTKSYGDRRTKGRPQKRQYKYQQTHGDGKDQECLKPGDEPADPGGKGCDRSQEGRGSTDANYDKSGTEQVASLRSGPSEGSLPYSAAHTHDLANEGQPLVCPPKWSTATLTRNKPTASCTHRK